MSDEVALGAQERLRLQTSAGHLFVKDRLCSTTVYTFFVIFFWIPHESTRQKYMKLPETQGDHGKTTVARHRLSASLSILEVVVNFHSDVSEELMEAAWCFGPRKSDGFFPCFPIKEQQKHRFFDFFWLYTHIKFLFVELKDTWI